MKVKVSGGQFFADGFPIRKGFELPEGEERRISYIAESGCSSAILAISQGRPLLKEGRIEIVLWQGGVELRPLPYYFPSPSYQKNLSDGGLDLRLTLRFSAGTELRLEGAVSLLHETLTPIIHPEATLIRGQKAPILQLRAECREGEYLALWSIGAEGAKLLLEEVGNEIRCVENEVTVTNHFRDLRQRKVISRFLWKGDHFDCSREIICANAQPFMREQSGRLLLEAAVARDEKEISSLLAPDLADPAAILDYFGKIRAVRDPLFDASPTAVAAEYREGDITKAILYDFDFDPSGKITNIRSLEDPA